MRVARPRRHDAALLGLWSAARERGLPHAFTFEGPPGTGRFQAAQWLAAGLLCATGPGEPCGTCGGCKKVASGGWRSNHADLFVVDEAERGEERIRLGRIAYRPDDKPPVPDPDDCMERFFPLRPLEGVWRVALVREAHRMTVAAQNALLKTLEEPPDNSVLILETDRPNELLDTVLSRCVRLELEPLDAADAAEVLAGIGLDPGEARALARWSGGAPGEALRLRDTGAVEMRELVVAAATGAAPARGVAAAVWEIDVEFPGSTEPRRGRQRARAFLDLALVVLRDALRRAAGEDPNALRHGDVPSALAEAGSARVREALEGLLLARGDIDANLAPDAAVERGCRALADLAPDLVPRHG